MAVRRVRVMTDTWGSDPSFEKGQIIEVDCSDPKAPTYVPEGGEEHEAAVPFPYDLAFAIGQAVVVEVDDRGDPLVDASAEASLEASDASQKRPMQQGRARGK